MSSAGPHWLTGGKVGAQVLRAKPGQYADALRHSHTLEFQFIYVPKAGRSSTTKAMASTSWSPIRPTTSRLESGTRGSITPRKCWRLAVGPGRPVAPAPYSLTDSLRQAVMRQKGDCGSDAINS